MIPRHGSVSIFLTGLSTFDTRSFGDFAKTTTTPTRVSTFDTSTSTRVCPFNKRSTGGNDSLQDGTFYTDEDVPQIRLRPSTRKTDDTETAFTTHGRVNCTDDTNTAKPRQIDTSYSRQQHHTEPTTSAATQTSQTRQFCSPNVPPIPSQLLDERMRMMILLLFLVFVFLFLLFPSKHLLRFVAL